METQIERVLFNYSNARKSWEVWCFLNNLHLSKSKTEIPQYVDGNELLSHCRFISLKDFYIEFYKLLKESKNNSDNLFTLLKDKIQHGDNISAQKVIDKLTSLKDSIDQILSVRDKFYAHLDFDYSKYIKNSISVTDIYAIFIAVEEALELLSSSEILKSYLSKIPSRDEFILNISCT